MGVLKDLTSLAKDKIGIAALEAKNLHMMLQSSMTHQVSPSGGQVPRVNMKMQSLIEREDTNLAVAVRIITGNLAWLPLKVRSKDFDSKGQVVWEDNDEHDFNRLWDTPNPYHITSEINTHITGSLLLTGNSFLTKQEGGGGLLGKRKEVTSIWPQPSWTMKLTVDEHGLPDGYIQYDGTKWEKSYELDEVVHHKQYNINDPMYGRSGLEPLSRQLFTEYQAELFNLAFFTNDGTPRHILAPEKSVSKAQSLQIEEFFRNRANPSDKSRLQILPVAGKIQAITPSMTDMEFLQMRKFHRERVYALIGIPPFLGGVMEFANYANALVQEAGFWRHTMKPLARLVAAFLTRKLLHTTYPDGGLTKLEYDLSGVEALQQDASEQAKKNSIALGGRAWVTVNEVRVNEYDLEPIEGGDVIPEPMPVPGTQPGGNDRNKPDQNNDDDNNDDGKNKGSGYDVTIKTYNRSGKAIATKTIDSEILNAHLKAFDHMATAKEPVIKAALKKFWSGQKTRVMEKLREETIEGTMMSNLARVVVGKARSQANILNDFMDLVGENEEMAKLFEPIIGNLVGDIGDNEVSELRSVLAGTEGAPVAGIGLAFDVDNPKVKGVIAQLTNRITRTNEATFKDIRTILRNGFERRLSIDEISRMINRKFKQYAIARADKIARTEMTGIANGASEAAWSQNGATHKTWLATLDTRTRDFHVQYHGERVGIDDVFKFGPEPMGYPGDPKAMLAGNVINCRCTTVFDFEPLTDVEIADLELQGVAI